MGEPLKTTLALNVPIKHGDEMITELELTEPTLESLMKLDQAKGDIERGVYTICAVTGLPPSVVKQLRSSDFIRAGIEAAKFMGEESPETGAMQSLSSRTVSIGRPGNSGH